MKKINVLEKFELFDEHWNPKIIGELNNQLVKVAKVKGEFVWHNHQSEDELFYVLKGVIEIHFKDKSVVLKEGEMLIVPKGVEHKPIAIEEAWLLLFEPSTTKHTGDVTSELTVENCERI